MTYGTPQLLDMRDCTKPKWTSINHRMAGLERRLQPFWLKPFFRLAYVRQKLGYSHWSRLWEYPWAILSANLQPGMRVLDVGSGGSAFPLLLGLEGYEVHSADPTLDRDANWLDRHKWQKRMLRRLGISAAWGLPPRLGTADVPVSYVPDSMQDLGYDDEYFDRVFCLSVMEHVPESEWLECMSQMSRVLCEGGRLVLTLDMSTPCADARQYEKLFVEPSLRLAGPVEYAVPISSEDKKIRHPGHTYETLGLVWDKA